MPTMPVTKDTIAVSCPKCGHSQREPREAYSTLCKKCHEHFRVQETLRPASKPVQTVIRVRSVLCFQCGTELDVPLAAESTMCKRCSSHVDLRDYVVNKTVSKNFRTYGRLVIEDKGYVLNTDSRVGEAVVKGRLIGKLVAERTLEIHTNANIKGAFSTGRLIIPAGHHFRWPEPLRLGGADISGELAANLCASGTVLLRAACRLFGNIEAANLVVEAGAVFVGCAKIGRAYRAKCASPR
ncbi:MAG TPA: polymer-forming cytoskeletal protein [Verrucomicrobiae bacterium]|nr:polymer-forming cytoskeletal protein [Verrucomicrobiae bacterium]